MLDVNWYICFTIISANPVDDLLNYCLLQESDTTGGRNFPK